MPPLTMEAVHIARESVVKLNFLPDCYGIQTSWELVNEQGQVVYSVEEGYYPGGKPLTT